MKTARKIVNFVSFVLSGELYNEAAEEAMASMKGRMANTYYALAEEAYALVEEEWVIAADGGEPERESKENTDD